MSPGTVSGRYARPAVPWYNHGTTARHGACIMADGRWWRPGAVSGDTYAALRHGSWPSRCEVNMGATFSLRALDFRQHPIGRQPHGEAAG
eukprot:2659920-Prymnesium_polylepis.1